mmetsp:Transcript_41195/g.103431  ORF Transcript_41195/g.103431 Transcript_41195/m.103431 type:complete len:215 (+) Transcript_41195:137-781(+)
MLQGRLRPNSTLCTLDNHETDAKTTFKARLRKRQCRSTSNRRSIRCLRLARCQRRATCQPRPASSSALRRERAAWRTQALRRGTGPTRSARSRLAVNPSGRRSKPRMANKADSSHSRPRSRRAYPSSPSCRHPGSSHRFPPSKASHANSTPAVLRCMGTGHRCPRVDRCCRPSSLSMPSLSTSCHLRIPQRPQSCSRQARTSCRGSIAKRWCNR